ncbi:TOMM precursor leader peptide-binding protein [Solwaraspora sp. WMMB335]|uniref:TOMM precursor leader peptide-binding protein n=1 Tax=Solwaraspora sp. WMMB335 TaxID=3404118 RepID=UPI003B947E74
MLFTSTPEGVLFHNAEGGFTLKSRSAYRFASLLVPYLDGRHRVADICAALRPDQRDMVVHLVTALYERDLARDLPVEVGIDLPAAVHRRFAAQLAYIEHYRDSPQARFRRFRDTAVAVLGTGPVARSCARSLIRNGVAGVGVHPAADQDDPRLAEVLAEADELTAAGCPAEIATIDPAPSTWSDLAPYDVVVVTDEVAAPGRTLPLLASAVPAGRTLLPMWSFGERAVVGPMSTAERLGCWTCALLRLGANGDRGAAADLWSGSSSLLTAAPSGQQPLEPVAAMLGNLLSYEIFRITTGALPPETDGKIIIQNLTSVDVLAETLLPHPACARCVTHATRQAGHRTAARVTPADLDAELAGDTTTADPEGQQAAAEVILADLDRRSVLIGRHAGVFIAFDDDAWTQTPLKVSMVEVSLGHGPRRRIAAFDIHHVAGARRAALHLAAEVYAAWAPPAPSDFDEPAGPALPRVSPAALAIASGTTDGGSASIRYRTATSLLTGAHRRVPAGAVQPLGPDNRDRMFLTGPAGDGAGPSAAAATWHGLRSAWCHLALLAAIRGRTPLRRVVLRAPYGGPELEFLAKSADNLGVTLELLDLTPAAPGGMHVLLARYTDAGTGATGWRAGAHTSWNRAAVAAVRDLLGSVQLGRQLADGTAVDSGDPLLTDFDPGTLTPVDDVAVPTSTGQRRPGLLADAVRACGYEPLVVETTPVDLRIGGVTTVRVLLARQEDR